MMYFVSVYRKTRASTFSTTLATFALAFLVNACAKKSAPSSTATATPTPTATQACALASTWTTANDFQLGSGQDTTGRGIFSDTQGNVYSASEAADSSGVIYWVVRKSTDSGATWTTADKYFLSSGQSSGAFGGGVDKDGNLWVVGYGSDSGGNYYWMARKSSDGGTTWTVSDSFEYGGTEGSIAERIASDSSGNLYVVGYSTTAGLHFRWIVRKLTAGGSSWSTVDNYIATSGQDSLPLGIASDSKGNVYVSGYTFDSSAIGHWIIRKSANAGSTWTNVDDYRLLSTKDSGAYTVAVDSSENLYAVGNGTDNSSIRHWIVRKSTDSGTTWTTIDDYQLNSSHHSGAQTVGFDASKKFYVAGLGSDSSSHEHWILRTSTDGSTWTTADDYVYTNTFDSAATMFTLDSNSNLYIIGLGVDSIPTNHSIVRELACTF